MKRAARVDSTHGEIVKALRQVGWSVISLAPCGRGVPDILAGGMSKSGEHRNVLMEIKAGKGKLNPAQVDWHLAWRGQVCCVRSVEDALHAVGVKV